MKLLFYFTIFFFYKTSGTICCPDIWKITHTIYYTWNCMYVDNETEKLRVDESKCPEYGNSREYTKSEKVTLLISDINSAISYIDKDSQAPSCAPPGTTELTNSDIEKFPISSTNNEYERYFFKAQWVNPNCFWQPKPNEKNSARLISNFFDWISKLIHF